MRGSKKISCFQKGEKERGTNNSFSLAFHILHIFLAIKVAGATPSYLLIRLGHVSRLLRNSTILGF